MLRFSDNLNQIDFREPLHQCHAELPARRQAGSRHLFDDETLIQAQPEKTSTAKR